MQGFANARSDIIASTLIDKQDMPRPRLIQRSRGCCVKIVVPLVEETLSSGHVWLHPLHVEVTTQECRQRRLCECGKSVVTSTLRLIRSLIVRRCLLT
jgi:hypothetical protein